MGAEGLDSLDTAGKREAKGAFPPSAGDCAWVKLFIAVRDGFSLNTTVACEDHQREKLERLYRYAVVGDKPEPAQLFRIERIEQVDATLFEISGISGSDRQPVASGDRRDLTVRYAHWATQFLAQPHHLPIEPGRRFVIP